MSLDGMTRPPGPLLLLWAPSKLLRELRAAALPELEQQYRLGSEVHATSAPAASSGPPPTARHGPQLPPLAPLPLGDGHGLLAEVSQAQCQQMDVPRLLEAAGRCTLLTAAIQPLATAETLEAAATATLGRLSPAAAAQHPLRTLSLVEGAARAPAERFLQLRLQQLGLGVQPAAGRSPLWCVQTRRRQEGPAAGEQPPEQAEVLLGLGLAAGARLQPAAEARTLGPTAMLPALATLSAGLACVRPGAAVLDPFCGSGSLLFAALQRAAALAIGSDVDAVHFAGSCGSAGGSSNGGGGGGTAAPVFMQADAARLQGLLPAGTADAILTDLPYGYRTAVAVGGATGGGATAAPSPGAEAACAAAEGDGDEEDWRHLLAVLLRLAGHVLVPGGRLLAWMPRRGAEAATGEQRRQLEELGQRHGLALLHLLPETRPTGYPREVALFERLPSGGGSSSSGVDGDSDRREQLRAALRLAGAAGVPVFNLPSHHQSQPGCNGAAAAAGAGSSNTASGDATPLAVQQRSLKYKQVRLAASGAAIDVWRWVALCAGLD